MITLLNNSYIDWTSVTGIGLFLYRTNQTQDYRKEGTPTHSPVSNCRKTEEGFSPRQKVGKVLTQNKIKTNFPTLSNNHLLLMICKRTNNLSVVPQSPLRFNPLVTVGRDLTFQGGCGSPPREDRIKILQRTKGSPMHGYSSIEITNVWGQRSVFALGELGRMSLLKPLNGPNKLNYLLKRFENWPFAL